MLYLIEDSDIKKKMDECVSSFKKKISNYNVNKININIFSDLIINYFGENINLGKLSNIVIINNNLIKISLFDKNIKNNVRKVIETSNLNVSTNIDNNNILINLPPITENYRKNIFNKLKYDFEKYKVNIRNIRKFFNIKNKNLWLNKYINEDQFKLFNKKIQIFTNNYINLINIIFNNKKKIILNN